MSGPLSSASEGPARLREAFVAWLESPLPGGAHWARTFGPLVIVLLALEAVTGLGLAAWYAPTSTEAWASVQFIQNQLELGWLLRGIHQVASDVLIAVALLHLVQGLLWGAWKAPRALSWLLGLGVLLLLVVGAHTGTLLPWDLRAYWAARVLVGIAGNQPVVGAPAALLIQGGPVLGSTTLTHLYALHAMLLPALIAGALVLRRWLAPGALPVPGASAEKVERLYPAQLMRDLSVAVTVVGGIMIWVWRRGGVPLGAPADPVVEYVARPEWYFLPIFVLRQWFTGSSEFVATTLLPAALVGFLAAIPFLHQRLSKRSPRAERLLVSGALAGLAVTFAVGCLAPLEDAGDLEGQRVNQRAEAWARRSQELARLGVPLSGPLTLYKNDPALWGQRVFERECASCHAPASREPYDAAVCLDGYGTRTWIRALLKQPSAPHFFGNTSIDLMEPFEGDEAALGAITEFLYLQTGRAGVDPTLAARGATLFEKEGCASCHLLDGVGSGDAPDLAGWASPPWLNAFIRDPGHARFYGEMNEMDAFDERRLPGEDLEMLIRHLSSQAEQGVSP